MKLTIIKAGTRPLFGNLRVGQVVEINNSDLLQSLVDDGLATLDPALVVKATVAEAQKAVDLARQNDTQVNTPRLRVCLDKTKPLTLTATWQTVQLTGQSAFNVDSFPGKRYDPANHKLIAGPGEGDAQYDVEFFYKFSAGLPPVHDIQLRFLIPAPAPIAFPFPDGDQFTELPSVGKTVTRGVYKQTLYFNSAVRQYGLLLQLKTESNILVALNRPVLLDGILSLFPR